MKRERKRGCGLNRSRIWMEIQKARDGLNSILAQIEASRISVTAAEKKLDAEERKLTLGRSTTAQVLQFQQDLSETRLAALRAIADGYSAQTKLWRATGTIFDRLGIVLR